MIEKLCQKCNFVKSIDLFGQDITKRTRASSHCKKCRAESEAQRRKNPEVKQKIKQFKSDPKNKRRTKDLALQRLFGIDIVIFEELLAKQNKVCAICFGPQKDRLKRSLVVDHCHKTGKVRGLLCTPCNQGIGHLKDDIKILLSSIEYLEKNK